MGIHYRLWLYRTGSQEALHVHFMQAAFPIGITVKIGQNQSCLQLSADLLLHSMGELHTTVRFLQLPSLYLTLKGIKGHCVNNLRFIIVYQEIDSVVQSCKQNAAMLQYAGTLPKDRQNFLHITVGYGMENDVKALV